MDYTINSDEFYESRPWPEKRNGRNVCILHAGEVWSAVHCQHYKKNDQKHSHCYYFKGDYSCVFEGEFFNDNDELFKV